MDLTDETLTALRELGPQLKALGESLSRFAYGIESLREIEPRVGPEVVARVRSEMEADIVLACSEASRAAARASLLLVPAEVN
jgi:hypothetical protein